MRRVHSLRRIIIPLLVSLTFAAGVSSAEEVDPWDTVYDLGTIANRNKNLTLAADSFTKALDIALSGPQTGGRIDRSLAALVASLNAQEKYSEARQACDKVIAYYQRLVDAALAGNLKSQEALYMGKIQGLRVGICRTIPDENNHSSAVHPVESKFTNSQPLTDIPYTLTFSPNAVLRACDSSANVFSSAAQPQAINKANHESNLLGSQSMEIPNDRSIASKSKLENKTEPVANSITTVSLGSMHALQPNGLKIANDSPAESPAVKLQVTVPASSESVSHPKRASSITSGIAPGATFSESSKKLKDVPIGAKHGNQSKPADASVKVPRALANEKKTPAVDKILNPAPVAGPLVRYCDLAKSTILKKLSGKIALVEPVNFELKVDANGRITEVEPRDLNPKHEYFDGQLDRMVAELRAIGQLPPPPAGAPQKMTIRLASEPSLVSFSMDIDYGPFMKAMQQKIKAQWRPPRDVTSKRVVALYKVWRDGHVSDIVLDRTSGLLLADQAAINTINKAAPFSPLPDGAADYVDVQFTFDYNVFGARPGMPGYRPFPQGKVSVKPVGRFKDEFYVSRLESRLAGLGQTGLQASFVIKSGGQCANFKIVQGSGSTVRDYEFEENFKTKTPFPPLPMEAPPEVEFQLSY